MGYPTPDVAPNTVTCRALFVPDDEGFLAVVRGALQELTISSFWEKVGTLTPSEAAEACQDMFDRFCFNEGSCRVIGEIIAYTGNGSPNLNWLACDGRELSQTEYPDLYDVIGSTYGEASAGNFRIPDLRGRSLTGQGTGTGIPQVVLGQQYGEASHTLSVGEMPSHAHSTGNSLTGAAVMPGEGPVLIPNPIPASTGYTGGDGAHNNLPPRLGIMYLIVAKDG